MRILDLGCGATKEKGAVGIDIIPLDGVDIIANLTEFPYPLANNSFDAVYLNDVIEHLPNTIATMEEIYRVARPDARVYIRVINWNSHYTAMDPTHVSAFTENSFDFFGARAGRSYYTHARFDVVRVGYQYNALAKRFLRSQRLMYFLSFYLCNILEGLNFELRVVKNADSSQVLKVGEWTDLFTVLRCPHCLAGKSRKPGDDPGRMALFQDSWLVCQEKDCGRKYPVYDGLPIMLRDEGVRWINVPVQDLPVPPPGEVKQAPVEVPPDTTCVSNARGLERMRKGLMLRRRNVGIIAFLMSVGIGYLFARVGHRRGRLGGSRCTTEQL